MLSARGLSAQQSCISGLLMNVAWFHMGIVGFIAWIPHEVFWHHGWVGLGAAFCFFFRYHEISMAKKWGNVEEAARTFRNLQHALQMICLWPVTLQGGLSSLRLRWDHDFCLAVPTSSNCSS
ncbi:unnamed protein product [Sphagnum jensenii]|uniref:Uncharacterized protein n=1 Tax=Sphagnum jensenii TaxID=128206 RepID=A0ABP0ZX23_9BRYO